MSDWIECERRRMLAEAEGEDTSHIYSEYPPPRRDADGSARMLGILLIAAAGFWVSVLALVLIFA